MIVLNSGTPDHYPGGYKDFRKSLESNEIDALVIAAPDHWHAPASLLAMQAGKHVYVEKPFSHNPREGEILVEAASVWKKCTDGKPATFLAKGHGGYKGSQGWSDRPSLFCPGMVWK